MISIVIQLSGMSSNSKNNKRLGRGCLFLNLMRDPAAGEVCFCKQLTTNLCTFPKDGWEAVQFQVQASSSATVLVLTDKNPKKNQSHSRWKCAF